MKNIINNLYGFFAPLFAPITATGQLLLLIATVEILHQIFKFSEVLTANTELAGTIGTFLSLFQNTNIYSLILVAFVIEAGIKLSKLTTKLAKIEKLLEANKKNDEIDESNEITVSIKNEETGEDIKITRF
jgi:hypothetical protein